jgi:hypothetical protein
VFVLPSPVLPTCAVFPGPCPCPVVVPVFVSLAAVFFHPSDDPWVLPVTAAVPAPF